MNKAVVAALVGVVGLALGFGAGYLWDNARGEQSGTTDSPSPTSSPAPAQS